MDNLSCMIVLLNGAEVSDPGITLLPGPVSVETLTHAQWRRAYACMAEHAGLSLAAAVEKRYDTVLKEQLVERELDPSHLESRELTLFSSCPDGLASGSPERIEWFRCWLQDHEEQSEPNRGRLVKVASADMARPLIESHPAIKWDDRLLEVCGRRGLCQTEDNQDHSAKVLFPEQHFSAWLPMKAIGDVIVKVAPLEELRDAVIAHPSLSWKDRLEQTCGQEARLIKVDDSDSTSQVQMLDETMTVWLPCSCLTEVAPSEDMTEDSSSEDTDSTRAESPRKRPRRSTVGCSEQTSNSLEATSLPTEVDRSLMAH